MEAQKPIEFEYAPFHLRALAFLIDFIIFAIGLTILSSILSVFDIRLLPDFVGLSQKEIIAQLQSNSKPMRAMNLTITALYSFYYAYFESSYRQATPGKRILKLKVVDINGAELGLFTALLRNFGKVVSQALFLIGYVMAAFTPKKQALHDIFARTLVVMKIDEYNS